MKLHFRKLEKNSFTGKYETKSVEPIGILNSGHRGRYQILEELDKHKIKPSYQISRVNSVE